MRRIVKTNGKSKLKSAKTIAVKRFPDYEHMDVDCKTALIQELIPLGLMHIEEMLQEEVTRLAGEKYKVSLAEGDGTPRGTANRGISVGELRGGLCMSETKSSRYRYNESGT